MSFKTIVEGRLKELNEALEVLVEEKVNSKEEMTTKKARINFLIDSINQQRRLLGLEEVKRLGSETEINPDED